MFPVSTTSGKLQANTLSHLKKKKQTPNIYSLEEGSTRIQNVLE